MRTTDYENIQSVLANAKVAYQAGQETVRRTFYIRIMGRGTQTGIELVTRLEFDKYGMLVTTMVEEE